MPTLHEGSSGPLARLFNDFLRPHGFAADAGDRFGRIAGQLQDVWAAWQARGLVTQSASFDGLWVPRFKRGSARSGFKDLSNHSWGTAFDINASANWLASLPAFPGENGCLFAHVAIAQVYGFGWGGHYAGHLDGMHFEAARILTDDEVGTLNADFAAPG